MSDEEVYDVPRPQLYESENELFSRLINPEGKTSYKDVFEYDDIKKRLIKKAQNLGFPELNTSDLTTGILVGKKSTFAYVWHTINMINEFVYIQKESGYDMTNLIKFYCDNLSTNLNASKSVEGALLKAITTKELKQIQEHRVTNANGEMDNSPTGLFDLLKKSKRRN